MHVRTHTREHLYYCSQCHYSSITKNCLKRHVIQKHSNILLKCPTDGCDYSTPDKYKLQAHLKVHTELVSRSRGQPVSPGCSWLAHLHATGGVPASCPSSVSASTLNQEAFSPCRLSAFPEPSQESLQFDDKKKKKKRLEGINLLSVQNVQRRRESAEGSSAEQKGSQLSQRCARNTNRGNVVPIAATGVVEGGN